MSCHDHSKQIENRTAVCLLQDPIYKLLLNRTTHFIFKTLMITFFCTILQPPQYMESMHRYVLQVVKISPTIFGSIIPQLHKLCYSCLLYHSHTHHHCIRLHSFISFLHYYNPTVYFTCKCFCSHKLSPTANSDHTQASTSGEAPYPWVPFSHGIPILMLLNKKTIAH